MTKLLPNVLKRAACLLAAVLPLQMFSLQALAEQCNDPAPGFAQNAENYNSITTRKLDREELRRIDQLSDMLSGRWTGTARTIDCVGRDNKTKQSDYKVQAEIANHFTGAIRLEAEKYRTVDGVTRIDKLFFSPETSKYRQGNEPGWRNYDVIFSGKNSMVFSEKYRVRNHNNLRCGPNPLSTGLCRHYAYVIRDAGDNNKDDFGFTRLIQDIKEITVKGRSLIVTRKLYVNGYFVSQEGWTLKKG